MALVSDAAVSIVRHDASTRPRRRGVARVTGRANDPRRPGSGQLLESGFLLRPGGLVQQQPNFSIYHGDKRLLKRRVSGDD